MEKFIAVIKKEILDAIRDSKSMMTAFLMPVILALVSFGTTSFLASLQKESTEVTLPIQGQEHILPLVAHLKEAGVKVVDAPESPEHAILDGSYPMVLMIPDNFGEDFREQRAATVNLLSDHSRNETQAKVHRIKSLINQWSSITGSLRLITRNVNPAIANPIKINEVNVTSDERLASKILSGLPMFILMIAFASGVGMISDIASGERERRSLEPLLINPISHSTLFLGKWAAASLIIFVVCIVGIALQFASVHISPTAELGLRLDLGWDKYFVILAILIPVIFLASALLLLVSLFARSFKDAQSYNGLIIMLPIIPGLYLTFNSGSAETWQMLIPIMGPTALFSDIIGGDGASSLHIVLTSAVSLFCAALAMVAGVFQLSREKTIFG